MARNYIKLQPTENGSVIRIPLIATSSAKLPVFSIYNLLNATFGGVLGNNSVLGDINVVSARLVGLVFPNGKVETLDGKTFVNNSINAMARAKFSVTEKSGKWIKVTKNNSGMYEAANAADATNGIVTYTLNSAQNPNGGWTFYVDIMVRF